MYPGAIMYPGQIMYPGAKSQIGGCKSGWGRHDDYADRPSFWSRLEDQLSGFLDRFRDQIENWPGGDADEYSSSGLCSRDHSQKIGEVVDAEDASLEEESMGALWGQDAMKNIPATAGYGPGGSRRRLVYGSTSPADGTEGYRILCYGDSNSIGYRAGKPLSPYGQELAKTLQAVGFPSEVTCCGLCGCTSEELVNLLEAPCLEDPNGTFPPGEGLAHLVRDAGPFDLVIIMVGTNDIGHLMDTRSSQAFVTHLHEACHTLGIPTVNVAPPTVAGDVQARELRKRLAKSMSRWANGCSKVLLSLDCETYVPSGIPQLWETDQIHLSINGSKQLGQQIASELTWVLEQL
jgi:lysophospholipase L1-like esterase